MADRGSTTETLSAPLYAPRIPSNTIGYYAYAATQVTTFIGVASTGPSTPPKVKVWSQANNRWELAPSS